MKLTNLQIQNFRSIEDSGEFSVDDVTCLVGKNEAGKSAILQSLYKLNPVVEGDEEFREEDYPRRHHTDYEARVRRNPNATDNVLTTTWALTEKEVAKIEGVLGTGALSSNSVKVTKGYDNVVYWEVSLDEAAIISHFVGPHESYNKTELKLFEENSAIAALLDALGAVSSPSPRQTDLLGRLKAAFPKKDPALAAIDLLEPFMPKFLYFPEYQKMAGQISIDDLLAKKGADKLKMPELIFIALLDLVGTTPEELQSIETFERFVTKLEGISTKISREIFTYWSQNKHLRVHFRLDTARPKDPAPFNKGQVFRTRIWNDRHQVSVGFDERSTGFVWFFSFLIWLSQVQSHYGENLFILLDEPGLSLHARAQGDLLRYIREKLRPHYQVLYTTHSPFMIDPGDILSARTVEDIVEKVYEDGRVVDEVVRGTKVSDEILTTDRDTLFPLQGALGYDITQTLFVGKNSLLVEGPSDLLYLTWFRNELRRLNKEYLDLRWTITPSEGLTKIVSFVALFGAQKLNMAVLTDFHEGEKKKVRELKESDLLERGHVFSADTYAGQAEADIEDILGRGFYVALVNRAYALEAAHRVPEDKPTSAPTLVVKEVEEHFMRLPAGVPEFDHYAPAAYLVENSNDLRGALPGMSEALDRFESLFKEINKLLVR